jgi:hypothetical protein
MSEKEVVMATSIERVGNANQNVQLLKFGLKQNNSSMYRHSYMNELDRNYNGITSKLVEEGMLIDGDLKFVVSNTKRVVN